MDVVRISLEALLQRATSPQNENVDTAAVEAFCALVNKEKDGAQIGVKLLASRMHSKRELEALQTLHILDYAMQKCGGGFQEEVGKFRFLNEMIKLVSPKYLGAHTPLAVKQKVLQLMYLWMLDYPKQTKIKDAYDMLKKQGVIKDVPLSVSADYQLERQHGTIFQDEEKGKLLRKLLQSKNPEDLQAANRLIKTMVKEDERKAEWKSKRISLLESVQNNVRLLNEMLDSFKVGVSSVDETELIRELQESCVRTRPSIAKLASESQNDDEIMGEILRVNDELATVLDKYHVVMVLGRESKEPGQSLLDFGLEKGASLGRQSNVDVLCDILSPIGDCADIKDILQPVSVQGVREVEKSDEEKKQKAFETLDALSESLLLENLQSGARIGTQFNKFSTDKTPMNLLQKNQQTKSANLTANMTIPANSLKAFESVDRCDVSKANESVKCLDLDAELTRLLEGHPGTEETNLLESSGLLGVESSSVLDDLLVDITTTPTPTPTMTPTLSRTISSSSTASMVCAGTGPTLTGVASAGSSATGTSQEKRDATEEVVNVSLAKSNECESKSPPKLSELFVDLKSIKPSGVEPIVALNEQNGVSLTLHFGRDRPHDDVAVMVVSIANKNELPMKNVLFRAIVPKACKVKLQPPSGSDLPACNPFLPPSAITQVMLIANPEKVTVSLKFIVSYNVDDELMTEMGEIETLPS